MAGTRFIPSGARSASRPRAGFLSVAIALLGVSFAEARPVEVVCTIPTLASLAREVGGELVTVTSLAKGDQDPHFVSPTPVLMKKTRSADLFVELGLSLDLWADEVVNGSGNPRIFRGQAGRVVASEGVALLEVPSIVSRELGDVHPQGNPHVWLDPLRAKTLAANIARGLGRIRPEHEKRFAANLESFGARIDQALFGRELVELVGARKLGRLVADGSLFATLDSTSVAGEPLRERLGGWLARAAALRGVRVVETHKVWTYFAAVFGLEIVGQIEERPGIPPGPRHQRQTIELIREQGIPLVLVDNVYDPKLPRFIAAEAGARAVLLPNQVGGEAGIDDYFSFVEHVLDELLRAMNPEEGIRKP